MNTHSWKDFQNVHTFVIKLVAQQFISTSWLKKLQKLSYCNKLIVPYHSIPNPSISKCLEKGWRWWIGKMSRVVPGSIGICLIFSWCDMRKTTEYQTYHIATGLLLMSLVPKTTHGTSKGCDGITVYWEYKEANEEISKKKRLEGE